MTQSLARTVSILGHPVLVMPAAALIVAAAHGAQPAQIRILAAILGAIGAAVMAYSWFKVRRGDWSHVDASVRSERRTLNVFLMVLLGAGAALAWFGALRPHLPVALALAAAMIAIAMALERRLKLSLHVGFATFATGLLWPSVPALGIGLLVTAAIAWSRLALGRHTPRDLVAASLAGTVAAIAYHAWTAA